MRAARRLRAAALGLYSWIAPFLLTAGAIAFPLAVVRWSRVRRLPAALALAAVSWLLLAARAALLVIFDLSGLPAIHPLYMSPAYQFAIVAPMLSICALLSGLFRVPLDGRNEP